MSDTQRDLLGACVAVGIGNAEAADRAGRIFPLRDDGGAAIGDHGRIIDAGHRDVDRSRDVLASGIGNGRRENVSACP